MFKDVIFWVSVFMMLTFVVWRSLVGMKFENACENACSPSRAITPIIGGENSCMCDEGHGMWRRQKVE